MLLTLQSTSIASIKRTAASGIGLARAHSCWMLWLVDAHIPAWTNKLVMRTTSLPLLEDIVNGHQQLLKRKIRHLC